MSFSVGGLTSYQLRTLLSGGFLKGIGTAWQPRLYNRFVRRVENKGSSEATVIPHIGDFAQPEKNSSSITFERPGGWVQVVSGYDTFTKGVELTEALLADFPELMTRAAQLPSLFNRRMDDDTVTMLVEGDTTTYGTVPDGVTSAGISFFSGTGVGHVFPGDVSYTTAMFNLLQAAQVSGLNIADPTAPTVTEFQVQAAAVMNYIRSNIKDTAGKNLFTGGEKALLIVPPNMGTIAREAFFQSTYAAGGANPYNGRYFSELIDDDARFTDTAIWYVIFEGFAERPLWESWRKVLGQEYHTAITGEGSDDFVASGERPTKYSVVRKARMYYGDWRLVYRVVFS